MAISQGPEDDFVKKECQILFPGFQVLCDNSVARFEVKSLATDGRRLGVFKKGHPMTSEMPLQLFL